MNSLLRTFQGQYSYHLNIEDLHQPDIALDRSKAKGGNMVLWQSSLDPFVTVIPASSAAVLVVSFTPQEAGVWGEESVEDLFTEGKSMPDREV